MFVFATHAPHAYYAKYKYIVIFGHYYFCYDYYYDDDDAYRSQSDEMKWNEKKNAHVNCQTSIITITTKHGGNVFC